MASSAPYTFTGTAKLTGGDLSQVGSLAIIKQAVRLASVAISTSSFSVAYTYLNKVITASVNGALSLDGVAVAVGDRVLIKNESALPSNNGVYVVTATGSVSAPFVLTRASDFNSTSNIIEGCLVPVVYGTTNANTVWEMNANNASGASPFVFDTSPIKFVAPVATVPSQVGTIIQPTTASLPAAIPNTAGFAFLGYGSTLTFTPAKSGIVMVTMNGTFYSLNAGGQSEIIMYYGTGTAPANAAAYNSVTATSIGDKTNGSPISLTPLTSGGQYVPCNLGPHVLTLTPGTTYWFDVVMAAPGPSNSAKYFLFNFQAVEF